ncbi:23S rRNA (cytidine-2'-O)-methyltransferase TlyA [Helicobacter suis]|uniref:23S rRNA (cytidine-2'-O)-methyltransferase TlyA n=1 Tax=Helicobacter suis TaxID=104628 RepID=UPI0013D43304|nr:TlyA family RNA methyltransferase [Helicobacter suis]
MRLDQYLVEKGLVKSRTCAKALILEGKVSTNGHVLNKPSLEVKGELLESLEQNLTLIPRRFISRAGQKLWHYLEKYPIDCYNKVILDVGSSTGGFAQVLLEKGAMRVVCIDVGKDQLDPILRTHPQIELHEKCDIRHFKTSTTHDLLTCDVSFISLHLLLKTLLPLSRRYLLLFKPQFEVGRFVKRNKKGVVMDLNATRQCLENFIREVQAYGLKVVRIEESSLKGKEGNVEFFIDLHRGLSLSLP